LLFENGSIGEAHFGNLGRNYFGNVIKKLGVGELYWLGLQRICCRGNYRNLCKIGNSVNFVYSRISNFIENKFYKQFRPVGEIYGLAQEKV
jgi:hypothetical protein